MECELRRSRLPRIMFPAVCVLHIALAGCKNTDTNITPNKDPTTGPNSLSQAPIGNSRDLLLQTWGEKAGEYNLDKQRIRFVTELLQQVVSAEDCQEIDPKKLGEALDRYLQQFDHTFGGKRAHQACYWMAWLLTQSAKRAPASTEDVETTRLWFREFTDKIIEGLDENAKDAMGSEKYLEYKDVVNQALDWTRETLEAYFEQLYDDPLFPVFKEPLSSYAEETVMRRIKNDSALSYLLSKPIKMMVLEGEFYTKKIGLCFKGVPAKVMFWIVLYGTIKEFRKDEYWGGLRHSASGSRSGVWPIEMYLRQKRQEPASEKEDGK